MAPNSSHPAAGRPATDGVPGRPPARRHLAGLEMRLALAGEDLEGSLAEASDRAMRRVPAAAAEAATLQALHPPHLRAAALRRGRD